MQCFQGKSVYKGIAMGPIVVLKKNDYQVKRTRIEDPEAEVKRVDTALEKSKEQLQKLYDKAVREVGEASAAIFEVHQMMLEDDDYLEAIQNTIRTEQVNAEYAVATTGDNFAAMFASMDDDYMKARSADIKDISERLVRNLSGQEDADLSSIEPSVIVADDLSPSETVQMDKDKILAFVTVHGSTNSHTAILARMMNIPALIGVPMELEELKTGMTAVVDGFAGTVTFDPDEDTKTETEQKMKEEAEKLRLLQELKGKENVTLDGHKINIYANIGSVGDIGYVLENDAGGIGLFRSEFLYLGRNDFPTEEEQFQAYKQAVQMMAGKKVIIRTLDIGADKQVDYFNLGNEDNPALGYRAIRICLTQKDIFKTQLRALLRAAVYGNLSIMYPMITSTEEVKKIYEIVAEVEAELKEQEIQYKIPEQGIMIETPAAAIISDRLAEMVDFFSIGTNDLTQYTLAIDRQNEKLDEFYNPHHEAILRMIQMVVDNAHKCGKWAGICGELGADPTLTEQFVRMGVDELSVAPSMVLKLRKIVREMNKAEK
ncbi:phosphoenolpyruvate--protein phosphotransferase [Blautia glucerasea]|uniref:phosphoenolpyruvate--protein phosphotransferase n=1 Tax=Blautia TaxID=572511 RepID=UPI00136C96F3|nr:MULTISPECIES: phosphoenolpyruvate--protein phosphotransferase [Blautia]MCB5550534.1 phosphoenolpyruvate--protein phosphotransferase [Blautia sp. MSK17_66]MCB6369274.1 phosphoenolpyruvate--protein phosphotransferase [Blautia glucerasea]MZT66073.1 phosphoenolpyruvate--protein phosphotransferase [Blautia sp. BIOML-A1]NSK02100.1 phosphoenolpyruvate--protein phosphotransferase [Blautia obeum]